uniref:Thioredoxin F isoform n=1 Tax=Oryza sativa TaxID=4530 RepID=O22545_ORYSA|nr:thioredoxin F isoform [Oryza sativa Indica Group]
MALRLSVSSSHGPASSPAISTCRPAACGRFPALLGGGVASQKRSLTVVSGPETRAVIPVRSSGSDTATVGAKAEAVAVTGQVTEVNKGYLLANCQVGRAQGRPPQHVHPMVRPLQGDGTEIPGDVREGPGRCVLQTRLQSTKQFFCKGAGHKGCPNIQDF